MACHTLDGDGGHTGPELTHIGARRDAAAIGRIVNDPNDEFGDSVMSIHGPTLSAIDNTAIAEYLAGRKWTDAKGAG